jgi:hypothetical protein
MHTVIGYTLCYRSNVIEGKLCYRSNVIAYNLWYRSNVIGRQHYVTWFKTNDVSHVLHDL